VHISDDDIRAFSEKAPDGVLIEARREDIEETLLQQRTDDALDAWLKAARAAARIQYREAVFE
jgi:hypothetical protein